MSLQFLQFFPKNLIFKFERVVLAFIICKDYTLEKKLP